MNKVEKIITEYKKTRVETKRTRYPKINLHPKFEKVLQLQISKWKKEGLTEKQIVDRMQRAIPFHVYDSENEIEVNSESE